MTVPTRPGASLRRDGTTWLLYAQFLLFGYFLYGFDPTLTLLRDDEHVSNAVAGLHGTGYAIGVVAVGLVGAHLVAWTGRATGGWLFLGGLAAGIALYASVPVVAVTLPATVVLGFSGSGVLLIASAALADHHGRAGAAAITEANAVAAAMGLVAPLLIGASVRAGYGWRPAVLLTVPAIVVLYLLRGRFHADIDATSPAAHRGPDRPRGRLPRAYWLIWAVLVCAVGIEFCMTLWCAELLRDRSGMSRAGAATGVTAIVAGLAVGRATSARLTSRYRPDRLLALALVVNMAGFAGFWIATTPWLAFTGLVVAGLGMALQYPLAVTLAIRSAGVLSDLASARLSLGTGIAVGCAPFLLGYLSDVVGIRWAYLLVPGLIVLAGLALRLGVSVDHDLDTEASGPGRVPTY